MASTSRKRKLQENWKIDTTDEEHTEPLSPASCGQSSVHHGPLANSSTWEEFDPNLASDSCCSKNEKEDSSKQRNSSCLFLPNVSILGSVEDEGASGPKKRKRTARRSLESDQTMRASNCENNRGCLTKHHRKFSAPAISMKLANPATSHVKTGIQKKLILKRQEKHVAENETENQDEETDVREHDSILKDMLDSQIKRNQFKNDCQSNNSAINSQLQTSNTAFTLTTAFPKKDFTQEVLLMQREDFDSNLDKDACGDSDDDLPDVLGSCHNKHTIQNNSIVWVKFKKYPHWPAIVKKLHRKKKQAMKVVFTFIGEMYEGDRAKTLRMNYKSGSILPYSCKDHPTLKEKGLQSSYSKYFMAAVDKTETFIMRKAMEPNLGIWEFFEFDMIPGFGKEVIDGDRCVTNENENNVLETDSCEDKQVEKYEETTGTDEENYEEEDIHDISVLSIASMPEGLKVTQEKRKERNQRFLEFMKTKQMQDHLCKVKNAQKESYFHKHFLANEKEASFNCIFGPIVEDDQQDEVMEILSGIYKKAYGPDQRALLANRNYLLSVWVPEAVLYSIMRVQGYGKERALKLLMKGPRFTKAENEQRHNEIISSATDLTHQEVQNTELKYKQLLKKIKRSKHKFEDYSN